LFALALPSVLAGFDGRRFASGALDTLIAITKPVVRYFFASTHLVVC
jgi:hypothetical protein